MLTGKIDALSAVAISANSDFFLRKTECYIQAKSQGEIRAQWFPDPVRAELRRSLAILGGRYPPEFCPFQAVVSAKALLDGDLDEALGTARSAGTRDAGGGCW